MTDQVKPLIDEARESVAAFVRYNIESNKEWAEAYIADYEDGRVSAVTDAPHFPTIMRSQHNEIVAEKDARIAELEAQLADAIAEAKDVLAFISAESARTSNHIVELETQLAARPVQGVDR